LVRVGLVKSYDADRSEDEKLALSIFNAVVEAQYYHGSGEPGFVNVDKITSSDENLDVYNDGVFAGNNKLVLEPTSIAMGKMLLQKLKAMPYHYIVNPCGEIRLLATGGYCVIGDLAPYFADTLDEVIESGKLTARALIRTNQMDFLYAKETKRTNRIGVSLTGIQEFAWKFFSLTFEDLLDEDGVGKPFWEFLQKLSNEVIIEADAYSKELGVTSPHTILTIKPAGTTSKLFALTEGAHLPPLLWYLRWVQFTETSPLLEEYEAKGYPVIRNIRNALGQPKYQGTAIVGFPTTPLITRLGIPSERLTMAVEATMEEQFKWVALLEQYWLGDTRGNQVSYTLKYDRNEITFDEYVTMLATYMPTVRCVSVMPSTDWKVSKNIFGYVPEEPVSEEEYLALVEGINEIALEEIDMETLKCASGACPI
jgi:hypothetical protein